MSEAKPISPKLSSRSLLKDDSSLLKANISIDLDASYPDLATPAFMTPGLGLRSMMKRRRNRVLESPLRHRRRDFIKALGKSAPSQNYAIGRKLGQGAFGSVHLVTCKASGVRRVLKTVNKRLSARSGVSMDMLQREIEVLKVLDHPHVVRLFEHYTDRSDMHLIMDVCSGGDLLDLVSARARDGQRLTEPWVQRCFFQVLEAISYCHKKGVMHKDLKLENIMLRDRVAADGPLGDIHAMVVDVGLAELFGTQHGKNQRSKDVAGSLPTMSPELLQRNFSHKCDVWSLGCVLFATLNPNGIWLPRRREKVFYAYPWMPTGCDGGARRRNMLQSQRLGPPLNKLQISAGCREVLARMLTFGEKSRPSAAECLKLPWFQGAEVSCLSPGQPVRALCADRQLRPWQKAALMEAAAQLPAADLAELERPFRSLDKSQNGVIAKGDLQLVLEEMGVPSTASAEAASVLLAAHDADRSGSLEWTEFVAAMLPASQEPFMAALWLTFQKLDKDRKGSLDRSTVSVLLDRGAINSLKSPTDGAWSRDSILDDLFPNAKTQISFFEFKSYFKKQQV